MKEKKEERKRRGWGGGGQYSNSDLKKNMKIQIQRVHKMILKWKNKNKQNTGKIKPNTTKLLQMVSYYKSEFRHILCIFHVKFVADVMSGVCVCVYIDTIC